MKRQGTPLGVILVFSLVSLGAVGRGVAAQGKPPCSKQIQAVCDAASVQDRVERERAIQEAMTNALQSAEREVRLQAFSFLCALGDGFDPRPLREALARLDELEDRDLGLNLIDEYELNMSSRENRIGVYGRAIADGETKHGTNGVLPRVRAMKQAAREGLVELESMIENYYPATSPAFQEQEPLEYLVLSARLHQGASSRLDVGPTAVRRLAAMAPEELVEHLRTDAGWRRVVIETGQDVCGGKLPDACTRLKQTLGALEPVLDRVSATRKSLALQQATPADLEDLYRVYRLIGGIAIK